MILPQVSELLSRVAAGPRCKRDFDSCAARRRRSTSRGTYRFGEGSVGSSGVSRAGAAHDFVVESNQRAEALLDSLRWFYRAVTGKPGHRVAYLPAQEVLAIRESSPHAEISEARAVSLWRFADGRSRHPGRSDSGGDVAHATAAIFTASLARTIERDETITARGSHRLSGDGGLRKAVTCEMPGQFAVRGGIIDVFSPEAPQPVRIELFGRTIESIRAFDPNTQRSTNPVERATFFRSQNFYQAQVLAAAGARSGSGTRRRGDRARILSRLGVSRNSARRAQRGAFRSCGRPADCSGRAVRRSRRELRKISRAPVESLRGSGRPTREPPDRYIYSEEEWSLALQLFPRLALEHSELSQEGWYDSRNLQTQPTTRYHGNVAAFMAEVRGRLSCRRARDGFSGQHGGTRAVRGHLPRIRTALPVGGTRRKCDRHATGGRRQQRQHTGDGFGEGAASGGSRIPGGAACHFRQWRSV